MALTIMDVLTLHIFKNHILLAGTKGSGREVSSVGIVDHYSLIEKNYHLFNEQSLRHKLLLSTHFTSFIPEHQANCLQFLCRTGASGLVILQSDLVEGALAPETLRLADKLGFPVIQSPRQYPSYSEIITDVMRAVTSQKVSAAISPALSWLKNAPEDEKTMEGLLRVISETAGLYVGLYDWNLNRIYSAAPDGLLDHPQYRRELLALSGSFSEGGVEYYFKRCHLACPDDMLSYAVIVSPGKPAMDAICQQISEIVQLFTAMHYKPSVNYTALGNALLAGDLVRAKHYAAALSTKIEDLRYLVCCFLPEDAAAGAASALLAALERFCVQNSILPVISQVKQEILLLLKEPRLESELMELLESFSNQMREECALSPCFFIMPLTPAASAKENYAACLKCAGSLRRIFPHKMVFSHQQILFAQNILLPFHNSPETIRYLESILAPLQGGQQLELIDTLGVYLLDANGNLDLAAKLLMMHKSTVKYRISRANELLDCDIRRMPEMYNLYLALAVTRLMK